MTVVTRAAWGSKVEVMDGIRSRSNVSFIVPSAGRPTLSRTVTSLLEQGTEEIQVIVVLDSKAPDVKLPRDSRLTVLRNRHTTGASANRNLGVRQADCYWVSFVDDDDFVSSSHARGILSQASSLPDDHAWVTGITGVNPAGLKLYTRLPPTASARGAHWSLSMGVTWAQSLTKQSLFAPRHVLRDVVSFDEPFQSRQLTELFWRLNSELPIFGSPSPTYMRTVWPKGSGATHIGSSRALGVSSFRALVARHRKLLYSHPAGYERLLRAHSIRCRKDGLPFEANKAFLRSVALSRQKWVDTCDACHAGTAS
jgi:hypothetical protein